jgi:hypothetical protein
LIIRPGKNDSRDKIEFLFRRPSAADPESDRSRKLVKKATNFSLISSVLSQKHIFSKKIIASVSGRHMKGLGVLMMSLGIEDKDLI